MMTRAGVAAWLREKGAAYHRQADEAPDQAQREVRRGQAVAMEMAADELVPTEHVR